MTTLPGIADIHAAASRLSGLIVETPLLESPALNERFGGRILFKPETLQRTGSFKFRGAYNKLSSLSAQDRSRGVVAFSSGNHAQGVAASAAMFGVRAVIAMPADAPAMKIGNVRAMGAEVVPFDRFRDDRMSVVRPYIDKGMVLVPQGVRPDDLLRSFSRASADDYARASGGRVPVWSDKTPLTRTELLGLLPTATGNGRYGFRGSNGQLVQDRSGEDYVIDLKRLTP